MTEPLDLDALRALTDAAPPLSLASFRARYEADNNEWWRIPCGDHMNLFDDACESLDAARAEVARLRAVVASVKALCDDSDHGWVHRRGIRAALTDVPMSPNKGHDLRERIAQRIDQAWAEANDRRPRSEYRDGYIDGLEYAESIARSTPLTEEATP